MPKKSTAKSVDNATVTVDEKSTVTDNVKTDDNKTEKVKTEKKMEKKVEPLKGSDEIKIVSLCPNVFYTDKNTGDEYEWLEIGHEEYMTVDTIKNMWRNHKAYFKDMLLKPEDERVIEMLGIGNIFKKYGFLLDEKNYTRDNLEKITSILNETGISTNIKSTVLRMIKDAIISGVISDIIVIRNIERIYNLDLVSLL